MVVEQLARAAHVLRAVYTTLTNARSSRYDAWIFNAWMLKASEFQGCPYLVYALIMTKYSIGMCSPFLYFFSYKINVIQLNRLLKLLLKASYW